MKAKAFRSRRAAFVSAIMLSSCAMPAFAQDTPAEEADEDAEIVVTGYRASLESSANAKREFDRLHRLDLRRGHRQVPRHQHRRIAQPHSRRHDHPRDHRRRPQRRDPRPRHQLHPRAAQRRADRDRLDRPHRRQNTNREVDLDLFPTELFTQLTVNKSADREP